MYDPYAPWCWNIYQHLPEQNHLSVGKYTIHGAYGLYTIIVSIIQCEAPKIAKLVYNSNNYGVWYL